MKKLKPCPFCGGEAYFTNTWIEWEKKTKLMIGVECGSEDCILSSAELRSYETADEAIEKWNRRA